MKVSVVVPTYSLKRYDDFCECVEAVLTQSYESIEAVLIVDGNEEVLERTMSDFGGRDEVVVYGNSTDAGPISRANMGAVLGSGELIVFTDDDALPEPNWIQELVKSYKEHDAIAVGGRVDPLWVASEVPFLPEEFYFLIGATHRGFPDEPGEIRNTFGANLGVNRDVFLKLGGMKLGGIDPTSVQGRETEFCARMQQEYGAGVIYNPKAVVYHRIYEYRCEWSWLLKRAFWQGYSKRAMEVLVPGSARAESNFLGQLLTEFIPNRLRRLIANPSWHKIQQFVWLFLLLGAVGLGYGYGRLRWW